MKKQILILTFFVAAILAGNNAFGQYDVALAAALDSCLVPTPLDCDSAWALQPAPGEEYTYTISSTDYENSGNELVHWFVIDYNDLLAESPADSIVNTINDISHLTSKNFIDLGDGNGDFILTSETGVYNSAFGVGSNTQDSVTISWKYFDGQANVVLLVAYVRDSINCTDNMEVYRIIPEPAFTLDIAAIDQTDYSFHSDTTAPAEECVSPIESAVYQPAGIGAQPGDGTLTVDYGENWLYFIVNAANFVDSWDPTFDFDYDGLGTITSAAWTYPLASANTTAGAWHNIDLASGATDFVSGGGGTAAGVANNVLGAGDAVGAEGECIIVRVQVDHGIADENLITRRLTVRVNGIMYDPSTTGATSDDDWFTNNNLADFGPDGDGDNVCDQILFDDYQYFDITPRPEVIEVDPTPFEIKVPDGN